MRKILQPILFALLLFLFGWFYGALSSHDAFLNKVYLALSTYFDVKIHAPTQHHPPFTLTPKTTDTLEQPTKVMVDNAQAQQRGITLYSDDSLHAYLMDAKGKKRHTWHLSALELKKICHTSCPSPAQFRAIDLSPNGDLTAIIINQKTTPWGGALIKMDKDSHVQWLFDAHCHHAFTKADDGTLFVLTHRFVEQAANPSDPINTLSRHYGHGMAYLDDAIVHLDAQGHRIKTLSILQMLKAHPTFVYNLRRGGRSHQNFRTDFDPLHTNAIQYITPQLAKTQPWLHAGDLLVNLRNTSTVLVIDPKKAAITKCITGPWFYPHDSQILPNGHLLMFDNLSQWPKSRIIEYDANTEKVIWSFSQDKPHAPMHSSGRGAVTPLENGNLLIASFDERNIIEVGRDKKIVWLYHNQKRSPFKAWRIPYHRLSFLNQTVSSTH